MPPTLPSPGAAFVTDPSRGSRIILAICVACFAFMVALGAACHRDPPPVAPGEPIPAAPDVVLGTMEAECDGLVAALAAYKLCPNLDDEDRWSIDGWTERMQQDFAAGKKAAPDASAQQAIAAACHKAVGSVTAAAERCHNGPRPKI